MCLILCESFLSQLLLGRGLMYLFVIVVVVNLKGENNQDLASQKYSKLILPSGKWREYDNINLGF